MNKLSSDVLTVQAITAAETSESVFSVQVRIAECGKLFLNQARDKDVWMIVTGPILGETISHLRYNILAFRVFMNSSMV